MKKILIALLLLQMFACSKKDTAATTVDDDLPPASSTTVAQGSFINGVHSTSGTATIVDDKGVKKLVLENFKTEAGPDLKVYLSNDLKASLFINLGDLKSTNGNLVYSVNSGTDLNTYKYTLIWCEQYAVLFGSAELK
ncbi:hypothetical protein BH10BAC2_BH10BAC2_45550 [soil metagenome]